MTATNEATNNEGRGADGGWITEAEAVRVALDGSATAKLGVAARALFELIKDTSRTEQVFLLGIVLNGPLVPRLITRIVAAPGGPELIAEGPSIDSKSVDFAALRALPSTTLGGAYVRYLDDNGLDPDLFQTPPGLPPVLRAIARRIRQTHDIWHVLTGYAPDVHGELALQGFTFAQLGMPSALVIATIGTAAKSPRSAGAVLEGYRRGIEAEFLPPVRFERMWTDALVDVRARLNVRDKSTKAGRGKLPKTFQLAA